MSQDTQSEFEELAVQYQTRNEQILASKPITKLSEAKIEEVKQYQNLRRPR